MAKTDEEYKKQFGGFVPPHIKRDTPAPKPKPKAESGKQKEE